MAIKSIYTFFVALIVFMAGTDAVLAQPKWTRSEPEIEINLRLFHSTKIIGLPTAEALSKGDFEVEISHRFSPPISDGYESFYGFDGPAKMRIAVGYAAFEDLMFMIGRSNIDDNTDFHIKYRLLHPKKEDFPVLASLQGGIAWNAVETFRPDSLGNMIVRPKNHDRHFQYFARLNIDFRPIKNFVIGLVPSYLYNNDIRSIDIKHTFSLGTIYQYYINKRWSLIGEWSFILSDKYKRHNPGGVGIELETGAHIFEIFVTNQLRINPSQSIAGSEYPFDGENLRIGFFINRVL
ncbi:MAG: DUF5777 family beta-barrel protein [Candidatus Zixiibacteriota bacterium]